jgi:hypothetical protein
MVLVNATMLHIEVIEAVDIVFKEDHSCTIFSSTAVCPKQSV